MIEMTCELHDEFATNSQFITHLVGRILWQQNLTPTPIDTRGFQTVLNLVDNTCKDNFDLFFGLYYYNKYAVSNYKILEKLYQELNGNWLLEGHISPPWLKQIMIKEIEF